MTNVWLKPHLRGIFADLSYHEATRKHNELERKVKKATKKDKRKFTIKLADQAQQTVTTCAKHIETIAEVLENHQTLINLQRSADGSLITTDSDESERQSTYLKELLKVFQSPVVPVQPQLQGVYANPIRSQISIKQLTNNKATGADNIFTIFTIFRRIYRRTDHQSGK